MNMQQQQQPQQPHQQDGAAEMEAQLLAGIHALQGALRQRHRYGTCPGIPADIESSLKQALDVLQPSLQLSTSSMPGTAPPCMPKDALRKLKPLALYANAMLLLVKRSWSPTSHQHASIRSQLEQAVRLAPLEPGPWNALGHVLYECADFVMSHHCLVQGLQAALSTSSKPSSVEATAVGAAGIDAAGAAAGVQQLCADIKTRSLEGGAKDAARDALLMLSMLVRQDASQELFGVTRPEALSASNLFAHTAVELDPSDGYGWYVLAMAQLAACFSPQQIPGSSNARSKELQRLLASFSQAEKCGAADLADLFFNRATVHTFMSHFEAALKDYQQASLLDPMLPVQAQIDALVTLLSQLSQLVASKGGVKAHQWERILSVLAKDAVKGSELLGSGLLHHERLEQRGITDLAPGINRGAALLCRPLVFLSPPMLTHAGTGLYLVAAGTKGTACFAISITSVSHDAVDMTASLTIVHPELVEVVVQWQGQTFKFPMVKADTVLVDGVPLQTGSSLITTTAH